MFFVLFMLKVNFEKKSSTSSEHWENNFHLLYYPRMHLILQHLIIQFTLYYLSSGHLQEVKNKEKSQTLTSKSGRGRLWQVDAYEKWS